MASSRRPRPLSVVLFTIATTLVLLAVTPGAASSDLPGPLVDVVFLDVWTNDDGFPNPGDVGDTGLPSPLYDAWDVGPISSSDPKGPGFAPLREDHTQHRTANTVEVDRRNTFGREGLVQFVGGQAQDLFLAQGAAQLRRQAVEQRQTL